MDYFRITKVVPHRNYKLFLVFQNGVEKIVDISNLISDGVSSALRDEKVFMEVKIQDGFIYWENGFDLCPNTLYHLPN